jgi:hypothetical protein
MMPFMVRQARDEFEALCLMDAMEEAGATILTLVKLDKELQPGASTPADRYAVWARVTHTADIDAIDEAIVKATGGL